MNMGEVIYAASSLKAFGSLIAVILVLGLVGLLGAVLIYMVYNSMTSGSETMTVQVNDKQIANDNCGNGETCKRYILETQSNARSIDLVVNEDAYDKVQTASCYVVTYYFGNGLFGKPENGSSYDSIDTITRIETAACP